MKPKTLTFAEAREIRDVTDQTLRKAAKRGNFRVTKNRDGQMEIDAASFMEWHRAVEKRPAPFVPRYGGRP
jgi:hypothetical protein